MSKVEKVKHLNLNGRSTTTSLDTFAYEKYDEKFNKRESTKFQWDYRDSQGQLHTGIARSLEDAKICAASHGFKE